MGKILFIVGMVILGWVVSNMLKVAFITSARLEKIATSVEWPNAFNIILGICFGFLAAGICYW